MRHKNAMEEEDKFRRKEMEKKLQIERIEKNKEWRDKKKREYGDIGLSDEGSIASRKCIEWMVRSELKCSSCQQDMSPPLKIYQCGEGHSVCQQCRYLEHGEVGPHFGVETLYLFLLSRFARPARGTLSGGTRWQRTSRPLFIQDLLFCLP